MKKPIFWTPEQRELVARRGLQLMDSGMTRLDAFYTAQTEVLSVEFQRTRQSLGKGLDVLEEFARKLPKPAPEPVTVVAEEPNTISNPNGVRDTDYDGDGLNQLDASITLNREPSLEHATPTKITYTNPHFDAVIKAAVDVLAGGFAQQIEQVVKDQIGDLEHRYLEAQYQITERITAMGNMARTADRMVGDLQSAIANMSDALKTVEQRHTEANAKSSKLMEESNTTMIQMAEIHEQMQLDLQEMSRMMEAYAAGEVNQEVTGAEEDDTPLPTIKRVDRTKLPRVLVIGLNGGFQRAVEKEFDGVLDMIFHPTDLTKKLSDMAKGSDWVILTRWTGHGCYDKIKSHKGLIVIHGGITSIKKRMMEIACSE